MTSERASRCESNKNDFSPNNWASIEVPMLVLMWKAVSTQWDTSDSAFVSWRIRAENDDGRERTVLVKIDASTVVGAPWTRGKGALRHVRDAMKTRGTSLVDSRQDRDELPTSIVYRFGAGGFVEE